MKKLSKVSCWRTGRVSPSDQHDKSFSIDLLLSCPKSSWEEERQPCHWVCVQSSPPRAAAPAPSLPQRPQEMCREGIPRMPALQPTHRDGLLSNLRWRKGHGNN